MALRLLHLTPFYDPAPGLGGMARAATGLCEALAARGHRVTVATARLDRTLPEREFRAGVEVHRFPGPAWLRRRLMPWPAGLGRFLAGRRGDFDVVHVHGARSWFALEAPRLGVPWVVQPHGTFPHHDRGAWIKAAWDRWAGRAFEDAAGRLAVSHAEAADLGGAVVVGNGVDLPEPTGGGRAAAPGRALVFVGSEHPQKRARFAVELARALGDVRLEMVGRFGPGFRRQAAGVGFAGVLDRPALAERLAAADLLVHPAVHESFGMVAFEAALAGVPAIVSDDHGCGEWFARAGGCSVPPDDLAAWTAAVRTRLEQPDRAAEEAARVARFTRGELTWPRAAERVEAVYDKLAGVRSPSQDDPT